VAEGELRLHVRGGGVSGGLRRFTAPIGPREGVSRTKELGRRSGKSKTGALASISWLKGSEERGAFGFDWKQE